MTVADVEHRLDKIERKRGDDEVAHSWEDELHQDVLRAIADGQCSDPAAIARTALLSDEIEFSRWCA